MNKHAAEPELKKKKSVGFFFDVLSCTQGYHPARVLPLVYLPFCIATIIIFQHHESRIDTRKRNITGYVLFCICIFCLTMVSYISFLTIIIHIKSNFGCIYVVRFSDIRTWWDRKVSWSMFSNCGFWCR